MPTLLTKPKRVRTTVDLPPALLTRDQRFVDEDMARSRNALMTAALEPFLDYLERQAIDAQFAAMANDEGYHALSPVLAEEFATSDWEAFELAEAGR